MATKRKHYKYVDIDVEELYDYDVIKNSLRNIMSIPKYSMPDNPNLGTTLHKHIFELMDPFAEDQFVYTLKLELLSQEKRIDRMEIKLKRLPEYNKTVLELEYYIKDTEVKDFLTMTLKNQLGV